MLRNERRDNCVYPSMGDDGDEEEYSRSHVQQGGGAPEGFPRVRLSPLMFVLGLLAKTIVARNCPGIPKRQVYRSISVITPESCIKSSIDFVV
jgi:hypothetical protein